MSAFSIDCFKNPDGSLATDKFVLRLRRYSLHPGVIANYLAEAATASDTPLDLQASYARGDHHHVWTLPKTVAEAFLLRMNSFESASAMRAAFKAERLKFPPTEKAPPVQMKLPDPTILAQDKPDEGESEDEDESENSDEDADEE